MTERKLATIRRIAEIKPIDGANEICSYRTDGWWVVDKINKYSVGDLCIMCEIDSWIPTEIAPFLSKGKEPREFNGIKGERLKTIKLKGQVSQGLLIPLNIYYTDRSYESIEADEGDDVSELLGITKWELSEKEFLRLHGENKEAREGGFLWYIPKSDQERIQNLKDRTIQEFKDKQIEFEVTEKLEGSSITIYNIPEGFGIESDEGVCSRNINLKKPEDVHSNKFWYTASKYNLLEKIKEYGKPIAIQGEMIGPGVCGNIYELEDYEFYLYNIWDISDQRWFTPKERVQFCLDYSIPHVPIITYRTFSEEDTIDKIIEESDGESVISTKTLREGKVYKSLTTTHSFKAVSNKYLLNK